MNATRTLRSITGADLLNLKGAHEVAFYADDDQALVATVTAATREGVVWEPLHAVEADGLTVIASIGKGRVPVRRFTYLVVREVSSC